jgi:maleylpyruvate isomerase
MTEDIKAALAGARDATARLMAALSGMEDLDPSRPSLLAGWTVGHVLTHLARNADSFVRIIKGAAEGREAHQYPGGNAQRNNEIEDGARRPAGEIVSDLRVSVASLDREWDNAPEVVWQRHGLRNDGSPFPCRLLPVSRWREVEVHHVDLGLGYGVADWPEGFVTADLPNALDRLPGMIDDAAQQRALLAWVYGRADQPGIVLKSF